MGVIDTTGIFSRRRLPVDDGSLTVNGIRLGSLGWWLTSGAVEVADATPVTSYADIPGMGGSVDQTLTDEMGYAYTGRRAVTCHLRTVGNEVDAIDSMERLAVFHGADVRLRWRGLPGAFVGRARLENRADTWSRGRYAFTECDLVVDAAPFLVGDAVSVVLPNTSLAIDGNRPAWPVISFVTSVPSTRVGVSDGRGHSVMIQSGASISSGSRVVIDCAEHVCTIAGNKVMPTLASDYFPILPGKPTLSLTSATIATVTYSPAWMI